MLPGPFPITVWIPPIPMAGMVVEDRFLVVVYNHRLKYTAITMDQDLVHSSNLWASIKVTKTLAGLVEANPRWMVHKTLCTPATCKCTAILFHNEADRIRGQVWIKFPCNNSRPSRWTLTDNNIKSSLNRCHRHRTLDILDCPPYMRSNHCNDTIRIFSSSNNSNHPHRQRRPLPLQEFTRKATQATWGIAITITGKKRPSSYSSNSKLSKPNEWIQKTTWNRVIILCKSTFVFFVLLNFYHHNQNEP